MDGVWHWARADLRQRWLSLAVLAILLAIAAGSVLALTAGARRAGTATERFAEVSNLAEVTVFVESEPSPDLLDAIARDSRVTGTDRSDVVVITPDPVAPGPEGLTAVGQPGGGPGGIGPPLLLSGRYPFADATDEVAVNERAALEHGLRAGDRTTLHGVACPSCEPVPVADEVTVTGVVRTVFDLIDDPTNGTLLLAPPRFLDGRWKDQMRPGTIVWLHLADERDALAVSQELSQIVPDGDVSNNVVSMRVAARSGDVQRNALLLAAGVVGLASVIVLGHAMARHLSVRQGDEPILASLGLARRQRWSAAIVLLAPAVLVGAIGAVAVAIALSPIFPLGLARRADPDPGLHADWPVLALGVTATLFVGGAVAAFVARRWLTRPDLDVPRASATTRALAALGLPPVPLTGGRFALEKGSGPSRLPTRSTVVAITAAMLVVCGALVLRSSLDGLEGTPARYGQPWNITVGGFPAEDLRSAAAELAGDARVDAVDLVAVGELDLGSTAGRTAQVPVLGMDGVDEPPQLGVLEGRPPNGLGEIALGTVTMRDLGVGIGDELTASGPCGSRRLNVTGRLILPLAGGDTPDEGSVVTFDGFEELCADELVADIDRVRGAMLVVGDPDDAAAIRTELEARDLFVEAGGRPSSVASLTDIRGVPMLVAALVGGLGLAAAGYALVLSVRRRRGELAVLRALGLRPGQAGGVVTAQAVVLVAVAVVIGLPLGIVLGKLVWTAIAEPSNVLVRTDLPPGWLALVVLGTGVLVVAMSLWPSRRARRLDVARALRSE